MLTATYSPEDNKLRLYASARLDDETYQRVKAAGFAWAPKQQLFVAPMWTPGREDLLLELCGEIGDEDTSLVERAEERAERFEDYSDKRTADAEAAKAGVDRIADGIPLGQPILVGHHSERHARRDAERIENGMRRAVKMWDTAQYWQARAAGAIRAAKYHERPDVRHRRIKTLESERRKCEHNIEVCRKNISVWQGVTDTERARYIAGNTHTTAYELYTELREGKITGEEAARRVVESCERAIERTERWIRHYDNRLEYERAMLAESGGIVTDRAEIKPGGRVLIEGEWLVVIRVNKSNGAVNSVTTNAPRYVTWAKTRKYGIEKVQDYREPEADDAAKVAKATKLAPICNFRVDGCLEMTSDEWKKAQRYSGTLHLHTFPATETTGAYRQRCGYRGGERRVIFLTDAKIANPPAQDGQPKSAPVEFERQAVATKPAPPREEPKPTEYDAIRETLKAGVQVVSAPQLFPTPPELAARMVEEANVQPWQTILEPSAGTGAILREIESSAPEGVAITAVEINRKLCEALNTSAAVRCADFLECNGDLGKFDRIIMNPPFERGADIKHIEHAVKFLKPGGRLVAICANGPRQQDKLRPLAENSGGWWEELPRDTFKEQGTGVSTALLVIEA